MLQIDLQWEGPSALVSRTKVSETLGLSAGQKDLLKKEVKTANSLRQKGLFTPTEEQQFKRATRALLSLDQQERWDAILGLRFIPQFVDTKAAEPAK